VNARVLLGGMGLKGRAACRGRVKGAFVSRSFDDPKHWRERAEEARAHAEQLTDREARRMMLEIAGDYEKLAKRAEERLKSSPQSDWTTA
jgi:hypothetical protein